MKDKYDPNISMNFRGDTLLHYACAVGDAELVKYLLTLPKLNKNIESAIGQEPYNMAKG